MPFASHPPRAVWLLGRLRAACWEAGSSRVPATGHACPAWGFWVAQLQGGIPEPLGQICSLSERGTKPAPSWADNVCIEVVNRKSTFSSSGGFLPLRREHGVRDISQDPDISCLLFPSCSSGWCQCPHMACFPVTFSICVLGKLFRHGQPWGPIPLCIGISQEDLAEGNLSCTPYVVWLSVRAALKEVVVPSVMGTDGWGGCPGRPPKPAAPWDHKEEQGTGSSLKVWGSNPMPLCRL